ncbi:MAG TPA: sortase [Patescibacteria group bacterium]|nr:sortase [Patescibacteria group bacterium]
MEQHGVVIYHHLYNKKFGTIDFGVPEPKIVPKIVATPVSKIFLKLAKITAIMGVLALITAFGPTISSYVYAVYAQTVKISSVSDYLGLAANQAKPLVTSSNKIVDDYMPSFDPTLPKTSRLVIPSIGVKTTIAEATLDNYEDALRLGVWRVSDFGSPAARTMPTIMAAHRFGYLAWTNSYRRLNSFYNLPKAKIGDTVEIDWQGRKYIYEIYSTEKGEQITDYSADLILYTCESLTGSTKDFVYARLLKV